MKRISIIRAVLVCSVAAGCSASRQDVNLTLSQLSQCVTAAKLAMRDSDFTQNLRIVDRGLDRAVKGEHGSYQGTVTCRQDQRTVEMTGPDIAQVEFYKRSIIRRL